MISDIIKLNVSSFVYQILQNDAARYKFIKTDNTPNINQLLNKLIPNLVYCRKLHREASRSIYATEFVQTEVEKILECNDMALNCVYFSDAELECLEERIWFRPSQKERAVFDEIEDSEAAICKLSTAAYIRSLLNEYSRFPQYKREQIIFDDERNCFFEACESGKIFHAKVNKKSIRMFAFHYVYEFTYDQGNYLIGYDLTNKVIGAIPLYKIKDAFIVERKYKPSQNLISTLQKYYENREYSEVISYEEEIC